MKIKENIAKQDQEKVLYVKEDMFPCLGVCCSADNSFFNTTYTQVCPYCQISTSLPSGARLRMSTIFECGRLGYGKRVTE